MKILFAGTPEIAVPALGMIAERHEVVGVLTNPDRECGRGRCVACCPAKEKAVELGLEVFQPERLDEAAISAVRAMKPDILVVVAFGKIFRKDFMELFPMGGINMHPSLLPLYRGASPIPAAILNGDKKTGVSIQRLAARMDSGAVLMQEELELNGTETTESLTDYFAVRGGELVLSVLSMLEEGRAEETPQDDSLATYCSYIKKDDGKIEWSMPAEEIHRRLRAFTPWPGVYTYYGDKKLNILEASVFPASGCPGSAGTAPGRIAGTDRKHGILIQTGEGLLAATRLQLQSRKAMDWKSFLNGNKDFNSAVLGG